MTRPADSLVRRMRLAPLWLAVLAVACAAPPTGQEWAALAAAPAPDHLDRLTPVWDNRRSGAELDIRLYVEPYCRAPECLDYLRDSVPALVAADGGARVRIYDYPLSQTGKAFLFSAVGRCVALRDPDAYFAFLQQAVALPDRYDNNVEMQQISKAVIGAYDTRCIHAETRKLQADFENQNPLGWTSVPATIVAGRVVYGSRPAQVWADLLRQARAGSASR
jgi:hypothetical protein